MNNRLAAVLAVTCLSLIGIVVFLAVSKPTDNGIACAFLIGHAEASDQETMEIPTRAPAAAYCDEDVEKLRVSLDDREARIKELLEKLNREIDERDRLLTQLSSAASGSLLSDFITYATAEGINPEAINVLADMVIPKLGEIPTQWELSQLAPVALDVFPKLVAAKANYNGDMEDPKQLEISLELASYGRKWNTEAVRILGPDRAAKIHW